MQSQNHWIIWTMAIAAGVSHALQCAMADYYRQFHLYFLKGESGSELESTSKLDEQIKQSHGFKRITMFFYRQYTANQERLTPALQRLRRELKNQYGNEMPPQQVRDDVRKLSLPLMKYTSVIIAIPWLYFAFELIVLNIMLVYMIWRHETFCKKLTREIKG